MSRKRSFLLRFVTTVACLVIGVVIASLIPWPVPFLAVWVFVTVGVAAIAERRFAGSSNPSGTP
jgi:membrane protein implicated in regulation of membrane protease activity